MKMCQMHNKKKDKLSYTVMLHCSAVTGSFVCHFWSISMTSGNGQLDKLCRFSSHRQHLPQPPCAYAIWPRAQRPWSGNLGAPSSRCLFSSTFLALVDTVPVWKPSRVPLHLWGGWERKQSSPYTRDVPGPPRVTRSGRAPTSLVRDCTVPRVQNSKFIPGTNQDRQLWCSLGAGEPSNSPSCCYSCISCNHPSGCKLLMGFKSIPDGEEGARQKIAASHQYTRVLLLLCALQRTGRCAMCL